MKRGKAQYSLEFLVTYGWALLIIGVVLGAIYTFGWVDASNFLPQRCTFYGQTGCMDYYVSESNVSVSVINNYGVQLNILNASLIVDSDTICTDVLQNKVWNRSAFTVVDFNLGFCDTDLVNKHFIASSRIIGTIIFNFHSPVTCPGLDESCIHTVTGEIVTKVQ